MLVGPQVTQKTVGDILVELDLGKYCMKLKNSGINSPEKLYDLDDRHLLKYKIVKKNIWMHGEKNTLSKGNMAKT
eukprot:UN15618